MKLLSQLNLKSSKVKVFCVYFLALVFAFFALDSKSQVTPTPAESNAVKVEAPKKTTGVENKNSSNDSSKKNMKKGKDMIAVFDTTMGSFKVRLFKDKAPKTVQNFIDLAQGKKVHKPEFGPEIKIDKPFYDGLIFHRVIKGFMIQGGCPRGEGTGGPGYKFEDEFNKDLKHSKPGILSMANSGPNTNGSQFFITVAKTDWLDNRHTVFGEVASDADYEIVKKISEVAVQPGDKPKETVKIKTLKIIEE